jgi:hypothetical protein
MAEPSSIRCAVLVITALGPPLEPLTSDLGVLHAYRP